MKKTKILLMAAMTAALLAGCGSEETTTTTTTKTEASEKPQATKESASAAEETAPVTEEAVTTVESLGLEDGTYQAAVTLEGGSGRATVESPAKLVITDGKVVATIVWSSKNYDYMIVDGQRYDVLAGDGNSTFEIPAASFDNKLTVIADTTAMSTPHEIEYTLTFDSTTIEKAE